MLHRNTLIAICAIFCAVAVGVGLFVANLSKQSGLIAQQPGIVATSLATAVAGAEPTATSQPAPTSAPTATAAPISDAPAYIEYTVQKGDLLNSIVNKYTVTT